MENGSLKLGVTQEENPVADKRGKAQDEWDCGARLGNLWQDLETRSAYPNNKAGGLHLGAALEGSRRGAKKAC